MAIANVPNIRDLGTVPDSNTMDEEEFSQTAEVFTGNMPGWGSDVHDVGVSAKTNAEHAQSQAQASGASANTAATSANAAQGFANSAQASKDAAATSAGNAQQSASAAAASLLSMQMLYLGPKAAPPTTNNQGGPLTLGAWFTNTTNGAWYWWSGTVWKLGMSDPDVGTVTWENVLNKPTLANGWLTDVVLKASNTWANLLSKPTTVAAAGLTDAVTTTALNTAIATTVLLTGDQPIAGKKTFSDRLKYRDPATLAQLTVGGTRKVVLNTASSQWITLCYFGSSNRPLYSRFILSCPERHWAAEITFSKTTAGAGGDSWASIRVLGAYSYFYAYPYQYRISGYSSNSGSFIEMRLPGFGSTSETYVLTVLEEYQTEDTFLIDYPLGVVDPGATRMLPNALTFGHSGGLYYRYGEIVCGGTYAPVIENNGAAGQTTLESVA
ncbi:hypothetical protein [Comamonas odontotermitis]|uniref:hypothetical protein n=1 Tax=Comamonas odontotermitis TaxID=379895 RepID=UPI001CC3F449|nr:hypothetical protein [Comamonas odontotermitis]UBB16130.1 hypothetical protein LAD35_15040 [Comamonas odontotermitis]